MIYETFWEYNSKINPKNLVNFLFYIVLYAGKGIRHTCVNLEFICFDKLKHQNVNKCAACEAQQIYVLDYNIIILASLETFLLKLWFCNIRPAKCLCLISWCKYFIVFPNTNNFGCNISVWMNWEFFSAVRLLIWDWTTHTRREWNDHHH